MIGYIIGIMLGVGAIIFFSIILSESVSEKYWHDWKC